MSVLSDFLGFDSVSAGVKTIADAYVGINNEKIRLGLAKTQNTIDELTAATSALKTQTEYQKQINANNSSTKLFDFSGFNSKDLIKYGLIAGGLFLAYRFIK